MCYIMCFTLQLTKCDSSSHWMMENALHLLTLLNSGKLHASTKCSPIMVSCMSPECSDIATPGIPTSLRSWLRIWLTCDPVLILLDHLQQLCARRLNGAEELQTQTGTILRSFLKTSPFDEPFCFFFLKVKFCSLTVRRLLLFTADNHKTEQIFYGPFHLLSVSCLFSRLVDNSSDYMCHSNTYSEAILVLLSDRKERVTLISRVCWRIVSSSLKNK